MPLPANWVDHLFAKLTVRYGAAFMRQWNDADPAMVKADWAEVLDGASGPSLQYAIANLPYSPPNAMQFRDICRSAPAPTVPELPAPPADPARVAAALGRMAEIRHTLRDSSPAQHCIDNIERIVAGRGGTISSAQAAMIESCLLMPGTSTTLPLIEGRVDRRIRVAHIEHEHEAQHEAH